MMKLLLDCEDGEAVGRQRRERQTFGAEPWLRYEEVIKSQGTQHRFRY